MRTIYIPIIGIVLIGVLVGTESVGRSQSEPASQPKPQADKADNEFRIISHSDLVLLDVSVKDPKGGFVSGLTKDQFKIFDNGKEQPIQVFEAGDIPVTVGLVVDNSGSMRSKKPDVVTAALTFITESNPADEMFVVNFNDNVRLAMPPGMPFTSDREILRASLLDNRVEGRTALNDALRVGLSHLEKGKQAKKTLVLISDGGDNASITETNEFFELAGKSRATIYAVGIYSPDDRDRNPGFLKKTAAMTGGECFLPNQLTELVDVCRRIAKDIRNRYAIGFIPSENELNGGVRKLKVVASAPDRGKLIVRTRTHYLAASTPAHQHAGKNEEHHK